MKLLMNERVFQEAFMKKMIPIISPLVFGLFGGLLVECAMRILSAVMSPFFDSAHAPALILLILIAILSTLFIALMAVANVAYLINLNNAKRAKLIATLEALAALVLFFVSWGFSGYIIDGLSNLI